MCFATLIAAACSGPHTAGDAASAPHWVGTWSTAQQLVEPRNMPPEPGLAGNTLRQVVHVSIGGERLRARFSNAFSTQPVALKAARIAESAAGGAIEPGTDRALRFEGEPGVTIPPGGAVTSDPFTFDLKLGANVALTIHYGATSPDVTGHPGSRTTSYLYSGEAATVIDLSNAAKTDHWYTIDGIDVAAPDAAAVVVLGDSITDGRGSGTNKQNRWPDELAARLRDNPGTGKVGVLNAGIGGNCVLRDCLGPAALDRFKRDVLDQAGVQWLIILEGINDIGQAKEGEGPAVAQDLIAAYRKMIDRAHAHGIRAYGATLLPFGGSFYDSEEREAARQTVNDWIRTSGRFDAVIDLDKALRDPDKPSRLRPVADTGDHLHPGETGHRMIAEAVDLSLFENGGQAQ
jgi:lysophospholipase L1-like esterase